MASVLLAHSSFAIDGNQWLEQARSTDATARIAAFTYLAGILDTLVYSGIGSGCPDIPDGLDTEQTEAILLKWFENNPQNRHFHLPWATFEALGDAYGFVRTDSEGICP